MAATQKRDETVEPEEESPLSPDMTQRAAALAYARATLIDNHGGPFSSNETVPKRFGTQDLIDVASWILDGADPLAAYREEGKARVPIIISAPQDLLDRLAREATISQGEGNGLLLVPESADGPDKDDEDTVEIQTPGSVQRRTEGAG
jgi:hypothetical protein